MVYPAKENEGNNSEMTSNQWNYHTKGRDWNDEHYHHQLQENYDTDERPEYHNQHQFNTSNYQQDSNLSNSNTAANRHDRPSMVTIVNGSATSSTEMDVLAQTANSFTT